MSSKKPENIFLCSAIALFIISIINSQFSPPEGSDYNNFDALIGSLIIVGILLLGMVFFRERRLRLEIK